MRPVLGFLATVLAGIATAGLGALWLLSLIAAPGPLAQDQILVILRGGILGIAEHLQDAGVIGSPSLFALQSVIAGGESLKAGEYAFPARISVAAVIDQMRHGRTVVRRLTVPEGLTSSQVVALIDAEASLSGEAGAVPKEGTLLPETYYFSYGERRAALLQRMRGAMTACLAELWAKRAEPLPLKTPEEAVTLASIVEKETGLAEERAVVAGVFINRLQSGMPLQSDPTVIYALTEGAGPLGRPLAHADLQAASPYNTYRNNGLPPGPIANPGRATLAAVLNPDRHQFLFFVADGTGGHAFARTLPEHNRNVGHWRQLQQQSAP